MGRIRNAGLAALHPREVFSTTYLPPSSMPLSVVLQLSLGTIGKARVKVPVVTMSPVASAGLIDRIAREQADEMAQRRQGAVAHIGGMAAIDQGAIAEQPDLEPREIGHPIICPCGRDSFR
jgi:hypothetical protein